MPTRSAPLALAALLPGLSHAADLYVPSDELPSIIEAFRVAAPGDVVHVRPDAPPVEAPLDVPVSLTVSGAGGVAPLPPLRVGPRVELTLRDVRFERGGTDASVPALDPCGGAALCATGGTVHAERLTLRGAAIVARDASVRLVGATLDAASVEVVGGTLTLTDVAATRSPTGAVRAERSTVSVGSSHFGDNAGRPGVDLRITGGSLSVSATTFEGGNESSIFADDAPVLLEDVVFRDITAARGAALVARATLPVSVTVDGAWVEDVAVTEDGGAFFLRGVSAAFVGVELTRTAAGGRGGAFYAETATLHLDRVAVTEASSGADGGAVAAVQALGTLGDVDLTDVSATGDGGGVWWRGGSLAAERLRVWGATGAAGGALYASDAVIGLLNPDWRGVVAVRGALALDGLVDATVTGGVVCDARSEAGAAVDADGLLGAVTLRNLRLTDLVSSGGAAVASTGLDVIVENVVIAGVDAPAGVVVATGADVALRETAIVDAAIGVDADRVTGGYNNLWRVAAPTPGGGLPTPTDREVSPGFSDAWSDGCDARLYLAPDSALRDAGDPTRLDADGTRADIGAWGGPWAAVPDADGDGVGEDLDCDDARDDVAPGSVEVPYDGVDQDCDGVDVCDADADGWDARECGGDDCDDARAEVNPGRSDSPYDGVDQDCDGADWTDADNDGWDAMVAGGGDCDDGDPAIHPGVEDTPNDRIDQDCDGEDRRVLLIGGGGCDHSADPVGVGAIAALLALSRRRRAR